MRVLKPLDWQEITSTGLDVVIAEPGPEPLDCVLWTREVFFGVPPHARPVLARAEVRPADGGLAHARFQDLESWGDCVIGIHTVADGVLQAAAGVRLGSVETRGWLRTRLLLDGATAAQRLRADVPVVACALSHIGSATQEPVGQADTLAALLTTRDDDPAVRVLALLQPELLDAHAVLDDAVCTGPDTERSEALLAQSPYRASVPYLAALRDVVTILPGGVVLPEGTRIWSDSTHAAFWLDPNFAQYPSLFRMPDGIGMVPDAELTEADLLADNERTAMPGIPLLAFGNAWRNHGHWMMNTLFAAHLLREAIVQDKVCVLVPEASDYVFDSMRAVGVPRRAILVARPGTYRFRHALFPSTLSIHANSFPPRAMAWMFRAMAQREGGWDGGRDMARPASRPGGRRTAPGPELVYVTRLGSPTQRWMTNEAELIAALRTRGFVCIAPHLLTMEEEVRCFARARVIVGQLGAGLLNVGFAPAGCRVVEIVSHNYTANDVWFLCAVLGHRFSRLMVHGNVDGTMTTGAFDFEVPLAPALALVDDVLGRL